MKHTLTCLSFITRFSGTLRGFTTIMINELLMVVHDITLHEKNGSRWVGLTGKPQLRDGVPFLNYTGRLQYTPIIELESRAVRDAFGSAVRTAVLQKLPEAGSREPTP